MSILYLVRHCAASGQALDAPLTDIGAQQALALRDVFATRPIQRILSSDAARAVASIQPVADAHQLTIEREPRLRERVLAPEPRADWLTLLQHSFETPSFKIEGAESGEEAAARIRSVLSSVEATEGDMIVVTHGNLLALYLQQLDPTFGFEAWRTMPNPAVYAIDCSIPHRFSIQNSRLD